MSEKPEIKSRTYADMEEGVDAGLMADEIITLQNTVMELVAWSRWMESENARLRKEFEEFKGKVMAGGHFHV